MRTVATAVVICLVSVVASARVANAQGAEFSLGAGASLPLSNFKDVAKTGYHGLVGISFAPSSFPLGIQIDGQYHRLKQKASVGNRTNQIIMGTANLIYKFKTSEDSKFRPYLIGGGGIYNFKLVSGTDVAGPGVGNTGNTATKFGFNAGAGFDIKAGGVGFFAEGRFHDVFTSGPNTKFIPITVGIRLGGN
jgi:Outer membrane protein beta-barrel domain